MDLRRFMRPIGWEYCYDRESGTSVFIAWDRDELRCIYDRPCPDCDIDRALIGAEQSVDLTARFQSEWIDKSWQWIAFQLLREHIDAAESDPLKVMQCQLT